MMKVFHIGEMMIKKQNDVITDIRNFFKPKVYPYWVTASDDQMNKVLKTCIYLIYGYAAWLVIVELWEKF